MVHVDYHFQEDLDDRRTPVSGELLRRRTREKKCDFRSRFRYACLVDIVHYFWDAVDKTRCVNDRTLRLMAPEPGPDWASWRKNLLQLENGDAFEVEPPRWWAADWCIYVHRFLPLIWGNITGHPKFAYVSSQEKALATGGKRTSGGNLSGSRVLQATFCFLGAGILPTLLSIGTDLWLLTIRTMSGFCA